MVGLRDRVCIGNCPTAPRRPPLCAGRRGRARIAERSERQLVRNSSRRRRSRTGAASSSHASASRRRCAAVGSRARVGWVTARRRIRLLRRSVSSSGAPRRIQRSLTQPAICSFCADRQRHPAPLFQRRWQTARHVGSRVGDIVRCPYRQQRDVPFDYG